jgi:hypothetical protein
MPVNTDAANDQDAANSMDSANTPKNQKLAIAIEVDIKKKLMVFSPLGFLAASVPTFAEGEGSMLLKRCPCALPFALSSCWPTPHTKQHHEAVTMDHHDEVKLHCIVPSASRLQYLAIYTILATIFCFPACMHLPTQRNNVLAGNKRIPGHTTNAIGLGLAGGKQHEDRTADAANEIHRSYSLVEAVTLIDSTISF